ncbi:PAS domain S-box-containing protein [Paenibacillus sp. PvP091]|nr:PAS domain S-box-containing protein [Paenibacillus sp. PvP091]
MMEVALHKNEQRYKSLFEYNSDLICELDLKGNIIAHNQVAGKSLLANHHRSWVDILGPDNLQRAVVYFEKAKQGQAQHYEFVWKQPNGKKVHWDIKNVPIYVNQDVVGVFVIGRDITQKKKTENALSESEAQYKFMAENMTDMVRIIDVNGICVYASPSHKKVIGYTPEQYIEEQIFHRMVHPEDLEAVTHIFNEMVESKQPRKAQFRVTHADGRQIYLEEYGTPVVDSNGKVENIVIVSRDITEKKLTEKVLAESEAQFRLMAGNMTDLLGLLDIEGTFWYASPSYQKVLGFDHEWMVGTSLFDRIHPDDLTEAQNKFLEMLHTKTNKPVRCRFIHSDGSTIEVDCLGTPVLGHDGAVESIIVVSRDITDKVQMEKELTESEGRYRTLIERSPQPMASHCNGKFLYINPAGVELIGAKDANDIIGKSILSIVHPDYMILARKRAQSVIKNKYLESLEYKMIRLDGQGIEVEVIGIYDDATQTTLTVFSDITERKKMERALQESEERYRRLVELSPVAIAVYKEGQFVYVNPAGMYVAGARRPKDIVGTNPLDWFHPDDKDFARKRMESTFLNGYSSPAEHRIIRLDGKMVYIIVTAIYDPKSTSVQLVFEDITAKKQAERALLESEELNRRLVELSPEAIVLHSDYKFIYVNPAGVTLFGESSLNDMIGRPIMDFIHPDYKESTALRLAGVYEQRSTSPLVEQKDVRMDGTIIDVEVIATSIPYKGKFAGLTLIRDITERKKIEEDRKRAVQLIRQSEDRYIRLQNSLDAFSLDLFGVMKVSEMEQRFVKEVQAVLKSAHVCLIEVDRNNHVVQKSGNYDIPETLLKDIVNSGQRYPICEIIEASEGCFLKIGEIRGRCHILCIGEKALALSIKPKRVWLKTITRYVSVLYDSFRIIEDLTKELEQSVAQHVAPPWLLRVLFNLAENERKRLSQDLHDAALQEQIIWYRKLDLLSTDQSVPQELREQLQQMAQGLLDVIYQIRITCNELRPPFLKEEGLVSSLEALFEFTQLRTNYCIEFDAAAFHHTLNDHLLIGIYRIVQELLANATKHSNASKIQVTLSSFPDRVELNYEDDGIGMDLTEMEDSFNSMGVYGMKERVRSMDGKIELHSSPNEGLAIFISIPAL